MAPSPTWVFNNNLSVGGHAIVGTFLEVGTGGLAGVGLSITGQPTFDIVHLLESGLTQVASVDQFGNWSITPIPGGAVGALTITDTLDISTSHSPVFLGNTNTVTNTVPYTGSGEIQGFNLSTTYSGTTASLTNIGMANRITLQTDASTTDSLQHVRALQSIAITGATGGDVTGDVAGVYGQSFVEGPSNVQNLYGVAAEVGGGGTNAAVVSNLMTTFYGINPFGTQNFTGLNPNYGLYMEDQTVVGMNSGAYPWTYSIRVKGSPAASGGVHAPILIGEGTPTPSVDYGLGIFNHPTNDTPGGFEYATIATGLTLDFASGGPENFVMYDQNVTVTTGGSVGQVTGTSTILSVTGTGATQGLVGNFVQVSVPSTGVSDVLGVDINVGGDSGSLVTGLSITCSAGGTLDQTPPPVTGISTALNAGSHGVINQAAQIYIGQQSGASHGTAFQQSYGLLVEEQAFPGSLANVNRQWIQDPWAIFENNPIDRNALSIVNIGGALGAQLSAQPGTPNALGTITSMTQVSNTVTCTATNNFVAGQLVLFTGLSSANFSGYNGTIYAVNATGLSSSSFQFTAGNSTSHGATAETGTAIPYMAIADIGGVYMRQDGAGTGGNTLYVKEQNGTLTLTLASVAAPVSQVAVYTGTITGGATNFFAGYTFQVAGFVNQGNNGRFLCTASTATTLTLTNNNSVAESHAATAKYMQSTGWQPVNPQITTVSSTYTATEDDGTINCNGTFTVTLPTTGIYPNKTYRIKNIGTGTVTVSSSVNIDFATSNVLNVQGQSIIVQWDGTQYWIY